MKNLMKITKLIAVFGIATLTFTACSGDDGIDGIDGATGPQGPAGQDGNANVISKTFQPNQITWTSSIYFGTNLLRATLPMNEITQDILDHGAVLVYGNFRSQSTNGSETWILLPYAFSEHNVTIFMNTLLFLNKVEINYYKSNNITPYPPSIPFRVVVIEGKAAINAKSNGVDFHNFHQVKNISD